MLDPASLALAVAIGVLAGFVSGLFGVGGGVLMVPAALFLLGTPFHQAKAVSLLVIVAVSGLGVRAHHRAGNVRVDLGARLALGGVVGSVLAVALAEGMGDGLLRGLFGVVLAGTGARMVATTAPRSAADAAEDAARLRTLAPLVGVVAGLLAGMFGVGGGILMVPAMAFLGVSMHVAVGTSLVAVMVNAAAGTAGHLGLGYGPTLLALGVPLAVGGALGVTAGARTAIRLHPTRLRRAFGAFLAVVGGAMAVAGLL